MKPVSRACEWEAAAIRAALSPEGLAAAGRATIDHVAAHAATIDHVAACESCRAAVAVASVLGAADAAPRARRLPDASIVWHRAQMRARHEDAREAARPILWMQIAVGAIVLLLAALWAGDIAGMLAAGATRLIAVFAAAGDAVQAIVAVGGDLDDRVIDVGQTAGVLFALGLALVMAAFGLSRLADRFAR